MTPPEKVAAAMPGTLAEIAAATEYPTASVLKAIISGRREGLRIRASMQPRDPSGEAVTIYVDSTTQQE